MTGKFFFIEKHFRKRFSKLALRFSVDEENFETELFIKADVNVVVVVVVFNWFWGSHYAFDLLQFSSEQNTFVVICE